MLNTNQPLSDDEGPSTDPDGPDHLFSDSAGYSQPAPRGGVPRWIIIMFSVAMALALLLPLLLSLP